MPQNGEIANPAMLDNPDGDVWKIGSTTYPPTPIGSAPLFLMVILLQGEEVSSYIW